MAELLLVNPRKRRARKAPAKRRAKTSIARRATSAVSKRISSIRKKYRRNPSPRANDVLGQFKDGAIGALGALAVDVAMQKLPIPANLKTGQAAPIVKGLVGIGVGMLVAKLGKNKALGKQLAGGAVTVSLYTAGRQLLAPTLGLAGFNDGSLYGYNDGLLGIDDGLLGAYEGSLNAYEQMNAYDDGLGDGDFDSMGGYVTGAQIVQ